MGKKSERVYLIKMLFGEWHRFDLPQAVKISYFRNRICVAFYLQMNRRHKTHKR